MRRSNTLCRTSDFSFLWWTDGVAVLPRCGPERSVPGDLAGLSLPYIDDVMQLPEGLVQADALVLDSEVETWI